MSTAEMIRRIAQAPPRLRNKFVGGYYLLTVLTGIFILWFHGKLAFVADFVVALFYLAVTALFYDLSRKLRVISSDLRPKPDYRQHSM
jgi:hypothetical protein